ncbi:dihydrofolate reductase [Pedobacter sp. MC2016-15]|uniref:dihydrofolate reductase n=1 Tax=Pedobacter sp. MC2016-15 TaxID=2994473 RepID=UPI002245E045|nr:dihydrofolate reductase [Pedobacter sp. MC2016-15]MCX2480144.1 dihydrofolate reductase [Pedobacter sp. MC2016-15]
MIISIMVAIAEDGAIGKNNQLLWHLPADLKHFKQTTSGHTVIMGRKTYDSVGKPLPNRRNIVISRNASLEIPGVELVTDLESAIALCDENEEVFIVGGAQIYRMAMGITDKIYLTVVKGTFDADTYFPPIDPKFWEETDKISFEADEKNAWPYTFSTLLRK